MSEWKETDIGSLPKAWDTMRIGNLIEEMGIAVGVMYPGENIPNGTPLIRAGDVRNNKIDNNINYRISDAVNRNYKRTILKGGEILVVLVGNPGLSAVVPNNLTGWNVARAIGVMKLRDESNGKFIIYALRHPYVYHNIIASCNTTVQPTLNLKELKEILIPWPEKFIRQAIADTLSSLDDKIDLLHRQNKTLEQLAETLFRQWFVEEGQKNDFVELGEYVEIVNGVSYKSSELNPSTTAMVSLKNFDRNGGFRIDGFKEFTGKFKEKQVVVEGDLIVAHTDITQEAEVIGNPALVFGNPKYDTLVISMDMVKVVSKVDWISIEFLYYLMKTREFKGHCEGNANGSTVLHLSKQAIPKFEFQKPEKKRAVEFTIQAKELTRKIFNNHNQIRNLTQLRDTLLPKLMSGVVMLN